MDQIYDEPLKIRELGTPSDIAFAQSKYPGRQIYACLPVYKDFKKKIRNIYIGASVATCGLALLFYPFIVNAKQQMKETYYIVTEDSVIFHLNEYEPKFKLSYGGQETKEIAIESIQAVVTNTKGVGCTSCAIPAIDLMTASDQKQYSHERGSEYGSEFGNEFGSESGRNSGRVPNLLYVDDVESLATLINQLRRQNKGSIEQSKKEAKTDIYGSRRVYIATENSPDNFKVLTLDNDETIENLQQKINSQLQIEYIQSIQMIQDGIYVDIEEASDICSNDKLLVKTYL